MGPGGPAPTPYRSTPACPEPARKQLAGVSAAEKPAPIDRRKIAYFAVDQRKGRSAASKFRALQGTLGDVTKAGDAYLRRMFEIAIEMETKTA